MIWVRWKDKRQKKLYRWKSWFAWHPVTVRVADTSPDNDCLDIIELADPRVCMAWLTWVERYKGSYWSCYRLRSDASERLRIQWTAIRLAPKYAKQIVMMEKTGG